MGTDPDPFRPHTFLSPTPLLWRRAASYPNGSSACTARGGARSGGRYGNPRWRSARSIDDGLNTIDSTVRRPPHGQHKISSRNTRRKRSDQSIRSGRDGRESSVAPGPARFDRDRRASCTDARAIPSPRFAAARSHRAAPQRRRARRAARRGVRTGSGQRSRRRDRCPGCRDQRRLRHVACRLGRGAHDGTGVR